MFLLYCKCKMTTTLKRRGKSDIDGKGKVLIRANVQEKRCQGYEV